MSAVTNHRVSVSVNAKITLELTEAEARALDGIFGYNVDAFLRVFYERMGRAYVEPHEAGVRSLHQTIRGALTEPLNKVDETRKAVLKAINQPSPQSKH